MNSGFSRNPMHARSGMLYTHHPHSGEPAPEGFAFNGWGEIVQAPYPPNQEPPWDFGNPLYEALYRGDVTIESQPNRTPNQAMPHGHQLDHLKPQFKTHDDVALVPTRAYDHGSPNDEYPSQDFATNSNANLDQPASIARVRYNNSKSLLALVSVAAPEVTSVATSNSQLATPISSGDQNTAAVGGIQAGAVIQWGHKGVMQRVTCDIIPGNLTKLPLAASSGEIFGRLLPKYYANNGVTGSAAPRQYLLFAGGPVLTNAMYSDLPPNVLALNNISNANFQIPAHYSGWFSQGVSPIPSLNAMPVRRFNGSVLSNVAANVNFTRIPIPTYAFAVQVIGGIFDPTLTVASTTITWRINSSVTAVSAGQTYGPFVGTNLAAPIQLPYDATSIDVWVSAGPNPNVEVPFCATYFLGV